MYAAHALPCSSGGARLARYIAQQVPGKSMLSLVGHSLGGLYCRAAITILHTKGYLKRVTPICFVTLATPHLGLSMARLPADTQGQFAHTHTGKELGMVVHPCSGDPGGQGLCSHTRFCPPVGLGLWV